MTTETPSVNDRVLKIQIKASQSADQFEVRLGLLRFIAHLNNTACISEIQEAEIDKSPQVIRGYLADLIQLGYVKKDSIWTYSATDRAKQLFGVK
jgi:predicted transcriptional regulator